MSSLISSSLSDHPVDRLRPPSRVDTEPSRQRLLRPADRPAAVSVGRSEDVLGQSEPGETRPETRNPFGRSVGRPPRTGRGSAAGGILGKLQVRCGWFELFRASPTFVFSYLHRNVHRICSVFVCSHDGYLPSRTF